MKKELINPPALAPARGFSHAVRTAGGATLHLGGVDASDSDGRIVAPGDIVGQYEQVVRNLQAILDAAGGVLTDIVKLNIYVRDRDDYLTHLRPLGEVHRRYFGDYYPALALFEVTGFFQADCLVEVEGTAVLEQADEF